MSQTPVGAIAAIMLLGLTGIALVPMHDLAEPLPAPAAAPSFAPAALDPLQASVMQMEADGDQDIADHAVYGFLIRINKGDLNTETGEMEGELWMTLDGKTICTIKVMCLVNDCQTFQGYSLRIGACGIPKYYAETATPTIPLGGLALLAVFIPGRALRRNTLQEPQL